MATFQPRGRREGHAWRPAWLTVLTLLYATGLIGLLALRSQEGPLPPFPALLNTFTPFLFLPVVALLPASVWLRGKVSLGATLGLAALFAALYGPLFLPRQTIHAAADRPTLRVMTFNLGPAQSQPSAVVHAIRAEAPDLVAVQELTPRFAAAFRAGLDRYTHTVLRPGEQSVGLLSRYPVQTNQWIQVGQQRAYLHAIIDWQGMPLHILAPHPFPPDLSWLRGTRLPIGQHDRDVHQHTLAVADYARRLQGPTIILGDLNMSDQMPAYRALSASFHDAYRETVPGFGFTFPVQLKERGWPIPGPFVRLDYIFHSDDFSTDQAHRRCDTGSDHCYVVATLSIQR